MRYLIICVICIIVGALFGISGMALCIVAKDCDEQEEKDINKCAHCPWRDRGDE